MDALLLDIVNQSQLEGKAVSCEIFGCGHVNKTYLVTTDTGHRYTLQRIGSAFKDVHALQENISAIVTHLHKKTTDVYGALTLRVTHNDTKLNNVMFRASDRTPLCVMDLDTTMPGLSAYDYGDAIRFGASTAAEDEKDLNKVWMDLELFRLFTKGFLEACPGLTDTEKEVLPLGAYTMTLECGMRFLTDYIDGDNYFGVHYPDQNLDRCRTQFKLVADMETKWEDMHRIVKEYDQK